VAFIVTITTNVLVIIVLNVLMVFALLDKIVEEHVVLIATAIRLPTALTALTEFAQTTSVIVEKFAKRISTVNKPPLAVNVSMVFVVFLVAPLAPIHHNVA